MAFNVNSFITNLMQYGTLQTNKFEVEIPLPSELGINNKTTYENILRLRTERVRLPGIVLDNIETRRYGIGPTYKTPTNVRFEPVSMSFLETAKSDIYYTFNDWIRRGIFEYSRTGGNRSGETNPIPTFLAEYKQDYISDITINVYNNEGNNGITTGIAPSLKIKLIEAFPISLGDNDLSWNDNNNLYRINVSFAYSYHQVIID